ncbi:hypothetical protein LXL04_007474 [Taraxacum kok-saghyz]
MECNKDEAFRAKEIAEKKMMNNDFQGARNIALKAKNLYPELDNISQLITVCDVHCSSLKKINGVEKDLYAILQIETLADEATIRKQYRKLALALHPDKNKFPGAEAAFKLIGEAHMTLSDKGKRSLYDTKCKQPVKITVTKAQNHQKKGPYDRKQFASQSNGVNHHHHHQQPPPPDSSLPPSFWTFCPFCSIKYEYYREFVNRPLRCQHCQKLFIAHDLAAQGPMPGSRQSQPQPPPPPQPKPSVSHMDEVRRREKVKAKIQKDKQFPSHFTQQNQTSNAKTEAAGVSGTSKTVPKKPVKTEPVKDTKKKRGRKNVTESSESEAEGVSGVGVGPAGSDNLNNRKSSRQKQQVSYDEDTAGGLSPQKRPRKSSTDAEHMKKENEKEKDSGKADMDTEADVNMPNGKLDDDDDGSDSDPEFVVCPDLEFSNFDKDKEENCFEVDQIWACYDSVDGMPRFYARIRKINTRNFKLKFTWLESDPDTQPEKKWAEEGLPVGCGKFLGGDTEETKDRLMFSHQIVYKNGVKRNTFFISPQKGEIWALFKDWDINWATDPDNHQKYKFDIVEIGDVHENGSVSVALLVKVKGFVSLFQKTVWGGLSDRKVPQNELFRFSHRIPALKLTGKERDGVPPGSFELDTASLPNDLEEYYYSIKPDNNNNYNVNTATPKKNVKGKNGIEKDTLNLRRSPRGLKTGATSSDGNLPKGPLKTVHDFSKERKIWKFCIGQVWAFWEDNRQSYGQIMNLETDPFRLQVCVLKSQEINACGLFKRNLVRTKVVLPPDVFSHVVKAEESNGKFKIYPKEQQIWALKDNADCTSTSIVEVLESNESSVKVLSLTCVPGYKSVFKAPRVQTSSDNIVVVPMREMNRFSRQIPAFLFTEEKDGELRGCWELDPLALAGLSLDGFKSGQ